MAKGRMIALQANREEAELFERLKKAAMARQDGEMIRIMMRECAKIFLKNNSSTDEQGAAARG